MVPRHRAPGRKERAAASRRRMLDAARATFIERGYHGATMTEIADRASMAVQTLSYHFGSKARLLSELLVRTVQEQVGPTPPLERAEWLEAVAAPVTGTELIDVFVDNAHPIMEEVSPLMHVARVGALNDEEVAEVYREHEEWRRRAFHEVATWLAEQRALRPDLSAPRATDIALTTFGPEAYVALLQDRSWTSEEISAWMKDALKRLLLPCHMHAVAV